MSTDKSKAAEASRRRQIQKQQRKKAFEDIQIQGTNNSSIASKRSVEQLYTAKLNPELGEWFKYFVPKPKRRSPAINRGYWLRMEAIRLMVLEIIAQLPHEDVVVINLGCGFDPLPFQLLNVQKETGSIKQNMMFYDIDYPELVDRKKKMVLESEDIKSLIGEEIPSSDKDCVLQTSNYKLFGCDLRYAHGLRLLLGKHLDSKPHTKIFVSEVALAYVLAEYSNAVIKVASELEDSHILILEQILPLGPYHPFAKKMVHHFDHLRSPILCINQYPTQADQNARFEYFFKHFELRDLWQVWNEVISEELKIAVSQIEDFDEWEEFIMFCQHYFILHALTTSNTKIYHRPSVDITPSKKSVTDSVKLEWKTTTMEPELELKFPAVGLLQNQLVVHGGLEQTRNDKTYRIISTSDTTATSTTSADIIPHIPISARMCHQLTSISKDTAIVTGGRSRPGVTFQDIYKITTVESDTDSPLKCTRLNDLQSPRWRHSCVAILKSQVLIFGGLQRSSTSANSEPEADIFEVYDINTQQSIVGFTTTGESVPNLLSCGITYNVSDNKGYIVGGIENNASGLTNGRVFCFTVDTDAKTIHVSTVVEYEPLLERIGCQISLFGNKLVVVGGINYHQLLDRDNTIISVDTRDFLVTPVIIPEDIWQNQSPLFIGFSMTPIPTPVDLEDEDEGEVAAAIVPDSETHSMGKSGPEMKSESEFAFASNSTNSSSSLVVFGGGAVCYAFGSYCNKDMYTLRLLVTG